MNEKVFFGMKNSYLMLFDVIWNEIALFGMKLK